MHLLSNVDFRGREGEREGAAQANKQKEERDIYV